MQIVDPRTGAPLSASSSTPDTGASRPQSGASAAIVDVDMSNFQSAVLEGSMQGAVLLAAYSSTQGDCAALMATLAQLADEYQGAFTLARLDIDAHPQIAAQLRVQSLPDVKLIVQGQLYDQFQGALSERKVREWLGKYVQAPEAREEGLDAQAQAALAQGDTATAKALYQQMASEAPDDAIPRIALAGILVDEGGLNDAKAILDNLSPDDQNGPEAKAVYARLRFAAEAPSAEEIAALEGRDDSEALFKRALRAIATGDYEQGLEGLLTLMQKDRNYGEDAARKTLIRVFDALGGEHPLTTTYRRRMFTLLY